MSDSCVLKSKEKTCSHNLDWQHKETVLTAQKDNIYSQRNNFT